MKLLTVAEALQRLPYKERTMYNRLAQHPTPDGGWIVDKRLTEPAMKILIGDMPEPESLVVAEPEPIVALEEDPVLDDLQARLALAEEEVLALQCRIRDFEAYADGMREFTGLLLQHVEELQDRVEQSKSRPPGALSVLMLHVVSALQRVAKRSVREPDVIYANRLVAR